MTLLRTYRASLEAELAAVGLDLAEDSYLFSRDPARSTWLTPSSVSQRYSRMCARLGWDMDIKDLRHYSATELIAAGVDVRTVAGRLGHGGGGVTTLRVYSAWRPEADKRAASTVSDRLPAPPHLLATADDLLVAESVVVVVDEPSSPYLRVVADLRAAIACGALRPGDPLPPVTELATRYAVAPSTAHRAIARLAASGAVSASRGKRAVVSWFSQQASHAHADERLSDYLDQKWLRSSLQRGVVAGEAALIFPDMFVTAQSLNLTAWAAALPGDHGRRAGRPLRPWRAWAGSSTTRSARRACVGCLPPRRRQHRLRPGRDRSRRRRPGPRRRRDARRHLDRPLQFDLLSRNGGAIEYEPATGRGWRACGRGPGQPPRRPHSGGESMGHST